jgi:hypothetical protein
MTVNENEWVSIINALRSYALYNPKESLQGLIDRLVDEYQATQNGEIEPTTADEYNKKK